MVPFVVTDLGQWELEVGLNLLAREAGRGILYPIAFGSGLENCFQILDIADGDLWPRDGLLSYAKLKHFYSNIAVGNNFYYKVCLL